MIVNPILAQAYEHDWFYPWSPPAEIVNSPLYARAVEEGWHEWIETPLDFEAMKHGYAYDLSLDVDRRPVYWIDGGWQLGDGTRIDIEDEHEAIGYVGRGDHMMRFCETFLKHTKHPLEGQPYRFIPWMRKIAATLFGWVKMDADHGGSHYRRYQHLYCALAKKNGKSAFMSVLAIYMLMADGTPKAQVYSCACDRNQARIIYDEAAHMVKGSPTIEDFITVVDSRARLVHQQSGSFYCVLSADAHRNDGLDSSATFVDEIHRHPNRKLYAVMQRAGQARPEPLMAVITTYGPSLSDGSIWAEVHNEAKQQLEGNRPNSWRNLVFVASAEPIPITATAVVEEGATRIPVGRLQQPVDASTIIFDASQLSEDGSENKIEVTVVEPAKRFQDYLIVEPVEKQIPIYSEATANLDWRSDHAIIRANPSIGVVFQMERLRKEIEESRTPEREAETRQLNLNIVSGSGRKWISAAAWTACGNMQVQPKKLIGRPCFGGLDISFGNDLIGFGLSFPSWDLETKFEHVDKPRLDLLTWAWTPKAHIEEREEIEQFPYRHYANQPYLFDDLGVIRFCEGQVIDFGQVAREIMDICALFQIVAIGYDPNYASFIIPTLEEAGIVCIAHRQGAVSMSPPCKRFSEGIYRGYIAHGNNPVLDRAVEGAQLHPPDKAGNTYLAKGKSHTRIDPLVAQVMAVGFATNPPVLIDGAWGDASTGMWG